MIIKVGKRMSILFAAIFLAAPGPVHADISQTQTAQQRAALAESLYKQATEDYKSYRFRDALDKARQLKALFPQNRIPESVYLLEGLSLYALMNYEDSRKSLQEVLRLNPKSSAALLFTGLCYGEPGEYAKGIDYVLQAIRLDPKLADCYLALGFFYDRMGRYEDSLKAAKETARLEPTMAQAHNNISYAYNQLGNAREALNAAQDALRLSKATEDTSLAYYNMALSYGKLKNEAQAKEYYGKSIVGFREWKRPAPDMMYYLGNSYFYLDQMDQAITAFKEAIRMRPNFSQAHLNLGLAFVIKGDKKAALDEYTILKSLDARRAEQLFNFIYSRNK